MKIKIKLTLGFLVIILVIIGIGGYITTQLETMAEISREVTEATEISQAALEFNVENFHTQLEVWEYAYEPTEMRLKSLEGHDEKLKQLLDKLVEKVETEVAERPEEGERSALFVGGAKQIEEIAADLEKVRADWVGLLEAIGEHQKAKEQGQPHNVLDQLEDTARVKVLANEFLFDELEFNKNVDKFVIAQGKVLQESIIKEESLEALISTFRTTIGILLGVLVVVGIGLGLYISRSISKPIIKLKDSADTISKGNLAEPIEIKTQDEIGELAQTFDNMRYSLKMVIEEYEKMRGDKETEEKIEELSKFPEANPHILMKVDRQGKVLYSNPTSKNYAKKFRFHIKNLLPKNYLDIVKRIGSNKSLQEITNVKGQHFLFVFKKFKDEEAVFITGIAIEKLKELVKKNAKTTH